MSATGEHRPGPPAGDAGATLLEMLVVIGLAALIGALVFASFRPALDRTVLEASRSELARTLDRARAAALRTGAPQEVEIAADGGSYRWGGRAPVMLAAGVRLGADAQAVRFSPNGLSPGARLVLHRGARALGVAVAPGLGVVTLPGPG